MGLRKRCPTLTARPLLQRSRSRRTDMGLEKLPPSPIEKLVPNQSVLGLTARTWALQNCMSLIPKTKRDPESGSWDYNNSFILNNMAERVGFEPTLPFRVNTLSKRAPSATRPSLRHESIRKERLLLK